MEGPDLRYIGPSILVAGHGTPDFHRRRCKALRTAEGILQRLQRLSTTRLVSLRSVAQQFGRSNSWLVRPTGDLQNTTTEVESALLGLEGLKAPENSFRHSPQPSANTCRPPLLSIAPSPRPGLAIKAFCIDIPGSCPHYGLHKPWVSGRCTSSVKKKVHTCCFAFIPRTIIEPFSRVAIGINPTRHCHLRNLQAS